MSFDYISQKAEDLYLENIKGKISRELMNVLLFNILKSECDFKRIISKLEINFSDSILNLHQIEDLFELERYDSLSYYFEKSPPHKLLGFLKKVINYLADVNNEEDTKKLHILSTNLISKLELNFWIANAQDIINDCAIAGEKGKKLLLSVAQSKEISGEKSIMTFMSLVGNDEEFCNQLCKIPKFLEQHAINAVKFFLREKNPGQGIKLLYSFVGKPVDVINDDSLIAVLEVALENNLFDAIRDITSIMSEEAINRLIENDKFKDIYLQFISVKFRQIFSVIQ